MQCEMLDVSKPVICNVGCFYIKGRRFLNFEFVHPDSAGESYPKTYLEKAFIDILSNSKRGRIFRS